MPTDNEIIAEAARVFKNGNTAKALHLLKTTMGMSIPDATEAIKSYLDNVSKNKDGLTAPEETSIKEALEISDTFDEMTVLAIRTMRDHKFLGLTQVNPKDPAAIAHALAMISEGMAQLVSQDVNPTAALTVFYSELFPHVCNKVTGEFFAQPSEDQKSDLYHAIKNSGMLESSLRDDLLSLL